MGAVAVYLKLKMKEQFVKFLPEIVQCACYCMEITIIVRASDIQIFLNRRPFAQWTLS